MSKKLLIVGMTENPGGKETYILNALRALSEDFEFTLVSDRGGLAYARELSELGAVIHTVPARSRDPRAHYRALRSLISHGNFDAVWCHHSVLNTLAPVRYAKNSGVPVRVIHSHSTRNMGTKVAAALHPINRLLAPRLSNRLVACSTPAGKWMYGNATFDVLPNVFDSSAFTFEPTIRESIRQSLGIPDGSILALHVARFGPEKNHRFLLDLMSYSRDVGPNLVLAFVGEGPLLEETQALAHERGLENSTLFLGKRDDVPLLLQGADVAVLPSHFEGLPYSLLEAQAAGLRCVASTQVDRDASIRGRVDFVSLSAPMNTWLKKVLTAGREGQTGNRPNVVNGTAYDARQARSALLALLKPSDRESLE